MSFLNLDELLEKAVEEAGYKQPTPVQEACFDAAIDGRDLFVSSETGSGKTAAYLLPVLERLLMRDSSECQALILVPTRELARQVLTQAKLLGRFTDLKFGLIGGGTDIKAQDEMLQYLPQLLIATPGRVTQLLRKDLLDLGTIEMLVLDEADRLLDMGFAEDVMLIAQDCYARKQTSMFSATLANKGLRGLADALLSDPETIELSLVSDEHTAIKHQIVFADDNSHKLNLTSWLIDHETFEQCVIFCNSKTQADEVFKQLQAREISAGILHGDRDQKQRNAIMTKMRRKLIKVLVATDLAARGLDIQDLDLVINFEMPRRGEVYVHRVGRTGRAGKQGLAVTLISAPEYNLMAGIERYLKQIFERRKIKELEGHYKGPKKLKASGKAAGKKKKKKTDTKKKKR